MGDPQPEWIARMRHDQIAALDEGLHVIGVLLGTQERQELRAVLQQQSGPHDSAVLQVLWGMRIYASRRESVSMVLTAGLPDSDCQGRPL